jgi:EthD domain
VIKVSARIPRRPDISEAEFHDHWRDPHAALALHITTLLGYVQSHHLDVAGPGLVDRAVQRHRRSVVRGPRDRRWHGRGSQLSRGLREGRALFIDLPNLAFVLSDSEVVADDNAEANGKGVKLLQLIKATGADDWATVDDATSVVRWARPGICAHGRARRRTRLPTPSRPSTASANWSGPAARRSTRRRQRRRTRGRRCSPTRSAPPRARWRCSRPRTSSCGPVTEKPSARQSA